MKRLILYLGLIILLAACKQQIKFNKEEWSKVTDPVFPPSSRVEMLLDLTKNHKLVGLTIEELYKLLGTPDNKTINSISYTISIDYGRDIDPIYTKYLVFNIEDSFVASYKVVEWKQ